MRTILQSCEAEYRRYKALAESAIAQVPESKLCEPGPNGGNSIAVISWHLSGNLKSRFTEFLTSDGEKPWRNREEEFASRSVSRAELMEKWSDAWGVLLATLAELNDDDLVRDIRIRGQVLAVHEALLRSLAHVSYHVGQIVYLAHAAVGADWKYLSIPPGGSAAYNASPRNERATAHVNALTRGLT